MGERRLLRVLLPLCALFLVGFATTTTSTLPPTTSGATVAPSTTAGVPPTESVTTKGAEQDDPAQAQLRWIIVGLVALAVVVTVFTVFLWRRTRPVPQDGILVSEVAPSERVPTPASGPPPAAIAARVPPVRAPSPARHATLPPGYRPPMWADETPGPRAGGR